MATITNIFVEFGRWFAARSKSEIAPWCFVLVLVIGYLDYITGVWISLSVVYVVPIVLAAWYVSQQYAYLLAVISAVLWLTGDIVGGAPFPSGFVPVWNGFIRLVFYAILIVVICRLRDLQLNLGRRVQERTGALTKEIAERQRLQREMMEVSNRVQLRPPFRVQ